MKPWSKSEDQFIRANYLTMSDSELARRVGRSFRSAQKRRQRLGLNKHPISKWTSEEDKAVCDAIANGQSATSVGIKLNRPMRQVAARARYLGYSFRKAKGRKDVYRGYQVAGHVNGVRVFEHTQIMEQAIGRKLKKGESVHHIDCNKSNNSLENLHLCRSVSEHRSIHHSLNALAGQLFSRGLVQFDKETGSYSLGTGQKELLELIDQKGCKDSALCARKVWHDAVLSLSLTEWAVESAIFRVHWVATVTLLRTIGNVLRNIDTVGHSDILVHVDELWTRVQNTTDDTRLFWEFIKPERDNVLKEYEFAFDQSETQTLAVDVPGGAVTQFEIDSELYRPMIDGTFSGDDSRDVLRDALRWWDSELTQIEAQIGTQ